MDSVEEYTSRSLYSINDQYLKLMSQKARTTFGIKSLPILFSYIAQGGFKRVFSRAKDFLGKDNKKKEAGSDYSIKQYDSFPNVKVVVYTCVWGKYDEIHEPLYTNPNIDYYIITDQFVNPTSRWKTIKPPEELLRKNLSAVEVNRYCKMLPHKIFPDYDYSIYIDGNVVVVTDMMPLIADMSDKVFGVHDYPITDCIYEMGKSIIVAKKAKKNDVENQLLKYKKLGFPTHFGAFECNILIRNHKSRTCNELMEMWWEEFCNTPTKRDQLSFAFVMWKSGFDKSSIHIMGPNVRLNPRFQVVAHK